jgi:ATP-binding cassette subfamily C protein
LTRQVEIVRDTFAGLILASRAFVVSLLGTAAGLISLAPILLGLILPLVLTSKYRKCGCSFG